MRKYIVLFGFFAAMSMGCASTSANVPTHTAADKTEVKSNVPTEQPDKIHKFAYVLADGTEFVWDEVAKAWHWIDSPDNKKRLERATDITKAVIKGAYEYGRTEWNKESK